jgi:uncharacterized membrane protein YhaH (DUF805 family)
MFALFNTIFAFVAVILDNFLGINMNGTVYGPIYGLYAIALIIPGIAVLVRRLHDVGKSGWMILVLLIPIIGAIWMLVLLCTDSQTGSNKWGQNPKEVSA